MGRVFPFPRRADPVATIAEVNASLDRAEASARRTAQSLAWGGAADALERLNRDLLHKEALREAKCAIGAAATRAMFMASAPCRSEADARLISDLAEDLSAALGRIGEIEGLAKMEGRK